jgi:hypothetical protein
MSSGDHPGPFASRGHQLIDMMTATPPSPGGQTEGNGSVTSSAARHDPYVDANTETPLLRASRVSLCAAHSQRDLSSLDAPSTTHADLMSRSASKKPPASRQLLLASLQAQRERLLARLKSQPQSNSTRIFPVIHSGQVALLHTLLQNRIVSVAETDYNGCTPLHVAAHAGSDDMVSVLLSYGAEVNALDGQGRTPLDLAYANGHTYVVRILVQAGQAAKAPMHLTPSNTGMDATMLTPGGAEYTPTIGAESGLLTSHAPGMRMQQPWMGTPLGNESPTPPVTPSRSDTGMDLQQLPAPRNALLPTAMQPYPHQHRDPTTTISPYPRLCRGSAAATS